MYIRSPKELAMLISNARKSAGLSQTEVAEKVGLKQKTISALENKPDSTKLSTLFRVLSAVCLDMDLMPKQKISFDNHAAKKDDNSNEWSEEW